MAALLYRPVAPISAAAAKISRSILPPSRTISMHVRTEILFQNLQHEEATPLGRERLRSATLRAIAGCAARLVRERGLDHVFVSG